MGAQGQAVSDLVATLRRRLGEIMDVRAAISLLQWDQETYMPPKGARARGEQLATLAALTHRLFTAPDLGDLLERLHDRADGLDPDAAALVAETRYDYTRASKLPESFVQAFAEARTRAYEVWVKARRDAAFADFRPSLEKMVGLLRQRADLLGYEGSPYNALVEDFERGMTTERLRAVFAELVARQAALVARIVRAPRQPDLAWLDQEWEEPAQWAFTLRVLADMGFDLEAGRQDKSVHPFSMNFDLHDVRLTTRVNPRDLFSALMASMHEGGHGLYDQGFEEKDRRTPLAAAPSHGMHESQSLLWENQVGLSRAFWTHYAPRLREHFPQKLAGVDAEMFYRAVNRVTPSLIRVDADECTYNLHIVLRFEIELGLIEGDLHAADVPEAWNAKMKQYLGVDVPNDAAGCLQDIHWAHGAMGYFPSYALGNLYAAQLFEKIVADVPSVWDDIEQGRFQPLLDWLREHVHRQGRRRLAPDLIRHVTGADPSPEPFLRYLEQKYGALYGL